MEIGRRCARFFGPWIFGSTKKSVFLSRTLATNSSSVDPEEIQHFEDLSSEWSSEESWFKPLHSYNKIRVPWIAETLAPKKVDAYPLAGKRIVDVACGGCIVSVPLARLGATVSGIDASVEVVNNARKAVKYFLRGPSQVGSIDVQCSTVEAFAEKNPGSFDAVVASEVVEHVNNLEDFVRACILLARPGASLFFTTLNKTYLSRVFAIWVAEEALQITPSGVHDWEKFVEPERLRSILEANGCEVRLSHGVTYNPLTNEWSWIKSMAINYAMMAVKL